MVTRQLACVLVVLGSGCASSQSSGSGEALRPIGDFHQHLFGPAALALSPTLTRVLASDLVRVLDSAGIRRAAVLSIAYQFGNPNRAPIADEYARVKAENDWTAEQVSPFADRLRAFCGVNPLKDYAIEEIQRCARDPRLRHGLKLHIGNSDVNFEDAAHLARMRRVFATANENGMGLVVHMRPSVTRQRPYGAKIARIILSELIPAAPDVPIQIAHLAGAGRLGDPGADEALDLFASAAAERDPRLRNVYFDVSGLTGLGDSAHVSRRLATRIRQIGVGRVLFGADGAVGGHTPLSAWRAFRKLPLTEEEFRVIARNVPPHMR